jgi:hypothetical protein
VTILVLSLLALAYLCRRPLGAWMVRKLTRLAIKLRPFGIAYVLLLAFFLGVLHV